MSEEVIAWNVDEFNSELYFLRNKKEVLSGQKDFLKNINTAVQEAWKGIAGASFDQHMDVDIKNYESILDDLDALITSLSKSTSEYESCERTISSEITSLSGKIQ